MDAVNLLVPSGALVSSAFFVSRLDRPVILQVPSMAANGVRLEWSTVSGTAPFAALHDPQAGALAATVFSGTAGGLEVGLERQRDQPLEAAIVFGSSLPATFRTRVLLYRDALKASAKAERTKPKRTAA